MTLEPVDRLGLVFGLVLDLFRPSQSCFFRCVAPLAESGGGAAWMRGPAWRDRLGDGFAPRLRDGGYGAQTGATARRGPRSQSKSQSKANLRRSTSVPSSPPVTPAATLCCRMTLEPVDRLGLVFVDRLGLVLDLFWTCFWTVLDLLDCLGLVGLSSGINLSKYLSPWMFCDAIFLPAFRFRGDDMDRFLPKRHTLTHGALKSQLPCQSKRK